LTGASIQTILHILYPEHGISINFPVEFPTTKELHSKLLNVNTGDKYVVDEGGYLHKFINNSTCYRIFKNSGQRNVSETLIRLLPIGEDIVEACQDMSLLHLINSKNTRFIRKHDVYIVTGDKMLLYSGRPNFNYSGFNMKNVKNVPEWEFLLLF